MHSVVFTPNGRHTGDILIVDDVESNLHLTKTILEKLGHTVRGVTTGMAALAEVSQAMPDLILLDVEMSEMNGFEVCSRLKSEPQFSHLPVIFVSADSEPFDKVRAFATGAVDYVTKPFQVAELTARVETHLRQRRLQLQLEQTIGRLQEANHRMALDLRAAARIQQAFLPGPLDHISFVKFSWMYKPCQQLGGDGLNIVPLSDTHFLLYILDVSGHGVASALTSVAISRLIASEYEIAKFEANTRRPGCATDFANPSQVAAWVNQRFPFDDATHQFTTMILGILNAAEGEFRYVCAGHPPPLHLTTGGISQTDRCSGFPIGLANALHQEFQMKLNPNDRVFLYSDGVVEAKNPEDEMFGKERLSSIIIRSRQRSLQENVDEIMTAVSEWNRDVDLSDDLSLLAFEYVGKPVS